MKKTLAMLAATGMLALAGTTGAASTASAATTVPSTAAVQSLVNRVAHAAHPEAAFNKLSPADKKLFVATAKALVNRVAHAAHPEAAFNKLSPADKKFFKEITTPYGAPKISGGGKLPQSMRNPAYTGCWSVRGQIDQYNAIGWRLATGYQTTNICAANGALTKDPWVTNVDGNGASGWSYDPNNNSVTVDNEGWEGRGAVRFAFTVGPTWGDSFLCLRVFVNSNGYNYRTDKTCPAWA
ncbi:hypothetical protein [Streptomyces sp. NPDC006739]|uniref:hypothetical protein n=1 Tax=Streptomyces sp. NPDC006739 TaxID=3364763 RepID=UPI0036B0A362